MRNVKLLVLVLRIPPRVHLRKAFHTMRIIRESTRHVDMACRASCRGGGGFNLYMQPNETGELNYFL